MLHRRNCLWTLCRQCVWNAGDCTGAICFGFASKSLGFRHCSLGQPSGSGCNHGRDKWFGLCRWQAHLQVFTWLAHGLPSLRRSHCGTGDSWQWRAFHQALGETANTSSATWGELLVSILGERYHSCRRDESDPGSLRKCRGIDAVWPTEPECWLLGNRWRPLHRSWRKSFRLSTCWSSSTIDSEARRILPDTTTTNFCIPFMPHRCTVLWMNPESSWIFLNPWEVPSWLHGCKDQWTCSCWWDPFAQCFLGSIRFGGLLTCFFFRKIKIQWNWWRVDDVDGEANFTWHKQNWRRMRSKATMHSMHSRIETIETGSCQLFELFKYMRETVCTDWPKKKMKKHTESEFLL